MTSTIEPEFLEIYSDVECEGDLDDVHQRRLANLLKKISKTNVKRFSENIEPTAPTIFSEGSKMPLDRKMLLVDQPTELITRIHNFLPQLEAANAELSRRVETNPMSVDIEHVENKDGAYIEMNLGLGIFDVNNADLRDMNLTDVASQKSDSKIVTGCKGYKTGDHGQRSEPQ